MATVTVLTADRMRALENSAIKYKNLHAGPTSMVVFGDSYVAAVPPVASGDEGIPRRVQSLLKVPYDSYRNLAVSGGKARSNRVESCYRTVWDFFNLKRTSGPYTPDSAYTLIKFDTNDAVNLTPATQEYGYVGALRSMIARAQAGSVFQFTDDSIVTNGRLLYWVELDEEPYRINAHDPELPWGSGQGCIMLEGVGEEVEITVPAGHTGFVDLYFIGAYYGGTVSIAVNETLDGYMNTGGCGIPWYGDYLTDERNGLVYRISDIPEGEATITVAVTALDPGVTGSTGFVGFDSWSIRASDENLPLVQLTEMAYPDGGFTGFWIGIDEDVVDIYNGWKQDLADECNTGLPDGFIAVSVAETSTALSGFDTIFDEEDVDGAGHPPRDSCAEWARIIAENVGKTVNDSRQISWHTSWETGYSGITDVPDLVFGSGAPSTIYDDFDVDAGLGAPWVITDGAWIKSLGLVSRETSGVSIITQDTGVTDGRVTAVQADEAQNNHGLVFRYTDEDNYVSLVQSSSFGNWVLKSVVAGVAVQTEVIVGPHVDGTVIDVVLSGDRAYFYFDGVESASSPVTISTNLSGTSAGLIAGATEIAYWSSFSAGVFNGAEEGQLYLDVLAGELWGPYNSESQTFPGPTPIVSQEGLLDILSGGGDVPFALKLGAEDIEITDPAQGIILTSPNSSRWRVTVNDDGSLTTTYIVPEL